MPLIVADSYVYVWGKLPQERKLKMEKLDNLRRINKTLINEDGTVDTFDKQLIDFVSGDFDYSNPFIVATDSQILKYISLLNPNYPLIMNVSTVMKLQTKHHLSLSSISNSEEYLKDSLFAFESLTEGTSIVVVLDQYEPISGLPYIMILRYDKTIGSVSVNEITSFYEKERFERFVERTFNADKRFFKNTEAINKKHIQSLNRLQLPKNLAYALSINYDKASFTKSQVQADLATQKSSKNLEINIDDLEIKASFHSINKEVNELYFLYELKWQDQVVIRGIEIDKSKDSQDDKDWIMQIEDKMEEICSKPSIDEYSELTATCINEFNNKDSKIVHPLLFGEKAMEVNDKDWSKDDVNSFEDECKQWIENEDVRVERMDEFDIGLIANIVASSSFWTSFALEKDSGLCNEIIKKLHERKHLEKTQDLEASSELGISR